MASMGRRPDSTRCRRRTSGWSTPSTAPSRSCATARSSPRRLRCCVPGNWYWVSRAHRCTGSSRGPRRGRVPGSTTVACTPRWQRYGELIGRVNYSRGYGDFVHYHLLARGALDVVIESDVNILDIAALTVIVREAGGTFTDLEGAAVDLGTTSVLASNGALHAPVLEALRR